jgi:hypothetical protein
VSSNARFFDIFSAPTERGPDPPCRANRHVTCARALSHAAILISISIGNERLRTANVKCDATLHLKSAERKSAGPVLGLDNEKRRCSVSQGSNWFLTFQ